MATDNKIMEVARNMVREKLTIRQAADNFGVSKTTVHKWINEKLCNLNKELYDEVKTLLANNKIESVNRAREFIRR